ncbi:unnamed protein product [Strongylus vulgaris]|uniref:Uncharacterized protein n=1 Tax=Strongylus vulgaris TaxID=40348 RepID=A0A3P7IWR0_STRVU|nr:unnamed protein product [Strongylus vulgaris]
MASDQLLFHSVPKLIWRHFVQESIIARDLRNLENKLTSQLETINLASPPLFEKTSNKFDTLIGVGISPALEKCISSFYAGVQNARDSCAKYEQVEMDSQPERIREALAFELFAVIERLSNLRPRDDDKSSAQELSRARLCLALLHCDSSSFCQAMNKDGERIAKASRLLKTSAEDSLSCGSAFGSYCCEMVTELFCCSYTLIDHLKAWNYNLGGYSLSSILRHSTNFLESVCAGSQEEL